MHRNLLTMIKISLLLLRKGDNPCEYMDDSEKFNETPLPQKKKFSESFKHGRYY